MTKGGASLGRQAKRATLPAATWVDYAKDVDVPKLAMQMREMSAAARIDLQFSFANGALPYSGRAEIRATYQALNAASEVKSVLRVAEFVAGYSYQSPRLTIDTIVENLCFDILPAIMLDRLLEMLEAEPT